MKTPEEIKHTLRYCWCKDEKYQCIKCPYNKENDSCDKALDADALAYIQQLEQELDEYKAKIPAQRNHNGCIGCKWREYGEHDEPFCAECLLQLW